MKSIISIFLTVILSYFSFAQGSNGKEVQILIKGHISDEFTGNPVSATMEFREENNGKRFKIQSNSADGFYQQVLVAGKKYDLVFTGNDIVRKIVPVTAESASKYVEQTQDYKIQKLVPGLKFMKLNAFSENSASMSETAKKELEKLKEIMQFNRGVSFEIVTNSHDTYKNKTETITIKSTDKKKSKKKTPPETQTKIISPDASLVKELADKRLESLKQFMPALSRFSSRLSTSADYSAGEINSDSNNLIIIVKEIKSIFE